LAFPEPASAEVKVVPVAAVVSVPAVTISRRELPATAVVVRRFLPLALEELGPAFSLVLEASDLESSG